MVIKYIIAGLLLASPASAKPLEGLLPFTFEPDAPYPTHDLGMPAKPPALPPACVFPQQIEVLAQAGSVIVFAPPSGWSVAAVVAPHGNGWRVDVTNGVLAVAPEKPAEGGISSQDIVLSIASNETAYAAYSVRLIYLDKPGAGPAPILRLPRCQ